MKRLLSLLLLPFGLFAQSSGVGQIWTSNSGTLQSAATTNTNGNALAVGGLTSVVFTVSFTFCTAPTVVNFQGTQDGSNWTPIMAQLGGSTTLASSVTTPSGTNNWEANISGYTQVRTPIASITSSGGTCAITVSATATAGSRDHNTVNTYIQNTPAVTLGASVPAGSAIIGKVGIDQTTPGTTNGVQVTNSSLAVTAASLPLPSGAATSAKQPALGTAGSAASDVLTVQGIASMTALKVDGAGGSFPVSGTLTSNTNADTTSGGTSAPSKILTIGGKTSDATPQYQPLPLTNGGSALKVDASATTQPVSGTVTANIGSVSTLATAAKQPALGTAGSASSDVISVQGITSMTPLKVDGAGGTFPVSGSVTANIGTAGTLATAAKQPALGTAGSASSDVISVQGITSMTPLKVDGAGGTFPISASSLPLPAGAAQDTSVTGLQVAQASATSGEKGNLIQGAATTNAPTDTTGNTYPLSLDTSGNLRVSLKDTPSNTNNLNVNLAASAATVTVSGTVTTSPPTNASTSVAQFGGNNVVTGTGASGAGIPRVTISNDSSLAANQSVNLNQIAGNTIDPCFANTKSFAQINVSSTTAAKLIANTTSKKTYICGINLIAAAAVNIEFIEGTKTTNECDTGTAAIIGGASTATGWNLAANGGIAMGSGMGTIMGTASVSKDVCFILGGAVQVSGSIAYVQQ